VPSSERSVIGGLSGKSKLSVYGTGLCSVDDSGPNAVRCLKLCFRKRSTVPPNACPKTRSLTMAFKEDVASRSEPQSKFTSPSTTIVVFILKAEHPRPLSNSQQRPLHLSASPASSHTHRRPPRKLPRGLCRSPNRSERRCTSWATHSPARVGAQ
jgi:hypothetical protein